MAKEKPKNRFQLWTEINADAHYHLQKAKDKSGKSIRKLINEAILKIKI